jgi:hypothetical protein
MRTALACINFIFDHQAHPHIKDTVVGYTSASFVAKPFEIIWKIFSCSVLQSQKKQRSYHEGKYIIPAVLVLLMTSEQLVVIESLLSLNLCRSSLSFKTTKSPEESVAVAVPGGVAVATIPMAQQPKQGGKCCGACCDYRRAVIVLSAISILFTVITLISGPRDLKVDDDDLAQDIEEIQDEYKTGTLIMSIFSLIMAVVSLVGAIQFNQYLVRNACTAETENWCCQKSRHFLNPNHTSFFS